ncbi:MAG TPA: hypothetical protein P5191_08815, partial [Ruminococcus sp.]|nr:hypothetical protein [Ruminococcus sp.]
MKKGSSSNSFPKTFSFDFSPYRAQPMYKNMGFFICKRSIWGKIRLKVFGKGVGEEPFLRKV